MAEREGFEPSEQVTPLNGLANECPTSTDVYGRPFYAQPRQSVKGSFHPRCARYCARSRSRSGSRCGAYSMLSRDPYRSQTRK